MAGSQFTFDEFMADFEKEMFTRRGTLYKVFEGALVKSIFSQLHQSYVDRSRKRTSKGGDKWGDLKPATIKIKIKKGFKATAELINIRSRQTINSFKPGRTTRFGYKPYNSDQLYEIRGATITIGSKLERKIEIIEKWGREVMPDELIDYIIPQAVKVAKGKVMQEIKKRYNR